MSEQGDKVRLTPKPREIIGEVAEIVPDECMRLVSGPDVYALRYWDVEVLERADDPSRDSIGTVAELDGHVWIKRSEQWWQPIPTEVGSRTNSRMTGRTVTGAVPGTPAAQAQPAPIQVPDDWMDDILSLPSYVDGDLAIDELFRLIESWLPAAKVEPLVVQYGDPEPEHDRHRIFTGADGTRVWWLRHDWWYTSDNGVQQWANLSAGRFPLREVVGP